MKSGSRIIWNNHPKVLKILLKKTAQSMPYQHVLMNPFFLISEKGSKISSLVRRVGIYTFNSYSNYMKIHQCNVRQNPELLTFLLT